MKTILLSLFILLSLSATAKNKTWTCINEKGETVFTIKAINVYEFHSGLARVYKHTLVNNKWITGYGFIDKTGKIVIDCNLNKAQDFIADVTWVKFKGQDYFSLIDKKGNIIPTNKYKKTGHFYSFQKDISAVYKEDKMGFIDITGKEIIPCMYTGSSTFNEELASVCNYNSIKGEYGFINKKGEEIIPFKFIQSGTSSFRKGLARAKVNGKTVLIDKKGKTIFKTSKGNIQGHNHGLVMVFTKPNRKAWGWLNFDNEFVIEPIYSNAKNFNDKGLAIVEKNGLKGLINTSGKVVIDIKYKTVYANYKKDGYYMGVYPGNEPKSLYDSKKDYFNADFKSINTSAYKHISPANFGNLLPFTAKDGRTGYLNRQYEVVIPAKYSRVNTFKEGLAWVLLR
ncbi:MAG: WG repeat-containing protein [Bacteroidota bacterium]